MNEEQEQEEGMEQGTNQDLDQATDQGMDQQTNQESTKEPPTEDQTIDQGTHQESNQEAAEALAARARGREAMEAMVAQYKQPVEVQEEPPKEAEEPTSGSTPSPTPEPPKGLGALGAVVEEAGELAFDTVDDLKAQQCAKISGRESVLYKATPKAKELFFKMVKAIMEEMEMPSPSPWVIVLGVIVYVFGVPFAQAYADRGFNKPKSTPRSTTTVTQTPLQTPPQERVEIIPEAKPEPQERVDIIPETKVVELHPYRNIDEYKNRRKDFRVYDDGSYVRANGSTHASPKGTGGHPSALVAEWIKEAHTQGLKGGRLNAYVRAKLYGNE